MHIANLFRAAAPLLLTLGLASLATPAQADDDDWATCAREGQTCRVRGEAMVRYGADGRYAFRVTRDSIPCTNEAFGSDPARGTPKQCEVSTEWRGHSRYRGWREMGSNLDDWVVCAYEGDYCRVPGNATVRYGADGRYYERRVSGGVGCNNGVFGDPVHGHAKVCEYRAEGRRDGGGYGQDDRGGQWSHCAREGRYCDVRGRKEVRYGANGRYVTRDVRGGIECTNQAFGADPAPGTPKSCEVTDRRR